MVGIMATISLLLYLVATLAVHASPEVRKASHSWLLLEAICTGS